MNIAVKIIVFTVIYAVLGAIFPQNLLTIVGAPLADIGDWVQQVAVFLSQLIKFSDLFLPTGQGLLMVRVVVLGVWASIQFKIGYAIVKLIIY